MERTIGVAAQNPRRPHIWNLPNLITLFRIAAIPFVVFFLFFPGAPESFLAALILQHKGGEKPRPYKSTISIHA